MNKSASLPTFVNTARELEAKLAGDVSTEGRELAREADALATVFSAWEERPPEPHLRSNQVSALLELQRRVMDHLAARPG